ncbi:MAG: HlyD family efflux transporter periplasmic adaptor subunit [Pseudomonadota bacterium]|nr:HlyD family efflux transporter periplasmic adaptor subunit [Pseudomonadota bacterium]
MIETKHVDASRRKHTRVLSALTVQSGPDRLDVVDWSPGGLRVSSVPASLLATEEVPIRVTVPFEGVDIPFDGSVHVVRLGPNPGEAGLAFVDLPPFAWEILTFLSQEDAAAPTAPPTLAPALASAGPPTLAPPIAPAPAEPPRIHAKAPDPQVSWRPPLRMYLYFAVGALLALYIGSSLYHRVWRIEVESATLVAPVARIASPADGMMRELDLAVGDRVAAGTFLFRVESPQVRSAVERAGLELAQAEIRVAELEAARTAEQERLAIHGGMVNSRIGSQRAQVKLLEQRLALAGAQVARVEGLLGQGVSQGELDEVRARWATVAGQLAQARGGLSTEQKRRVAARSGFYFDGDGGQEGLPEVEAALVAARAEVALEKDQLVGEQAHAEVAEVGRAPFAGRVAQVLQTSGTPVRQGDLVVVLEREDGRLVEAWVTRQQAEYVRIGDAAEIAVAGLGRSYDGVVRTIETDPGASAQVAAAGDSPRLQVLLEVAGFAGEPDTLDAATQELREVDSVGLPAVVSFARSWR